MRTNEERIAAMHGRALKLQKEEKDRRFFSVCAVSAVVCAGILIGMSAIFPRVSEKRFPEASESMNASIFAGSNMLSYLVIAILAFLLGILVTVFCFRLKKWMSEKDRRDF